jgi:hypothetical protein
VTGHVEQSRALRFARLFVIEGTVKGTAHLVGQGARKAVAHDQTFLDETRAVALPGRSGLVAA